MKPEQEIQRRDLASLKPKSKQSKYLRNVLAIPNEPIWPVISQEEELKLTEYLEIVSAAKVNKPKLPWNEARYISKEERRSKETQMFKSLPARTQDEIEKALKIRKCLFLGVNSVLQGMDNGQAACCIVAKEANPQILVKPVILLANEKKVPAVVLPNLKSVTKNTIGFACLAIGFKFPSEEDNYFQSICSYLKQIAEKFSYEEEDGRKKISLSFHSLSPIFKYDANQVQTPLSKLHLLRESNESRVFSPQLKPTVHYPDIGYLSLNPTATSIPPKIEMKDEKVFEMDCEEDEVGSQDSDLEGKFVIDRKPAVLHQPKNKFSRKSQVKYLPPRVNRLQSNPDKIKIKKRKKVKMCK